MEGKQLNGFGDVRRRLFEALGKQKMINGLAEESKGHISDATERERYCRDAKREVQSKSEAQRLIVQHCLKCFSLPKPKKKML